MAAQVVDARVERRVGTTGSVCAERAGDQRRFEQRLRGEQARQRIGGRELGAVQQRQALLGAQYHGLEAGALQRCGGRQPAVGRVDRPDPDHRRREV